MDDSKLLEEFNLTAHQPCRAPQRVTRLIKLELLDLHQSVGTSATFKIVYQFFQ